MKPQILIVSLLILAGSCFAQEQLDVSVSIVTYQQADSAEVIKQDPGVIVVAEGIRPGVKYAAKVRVTNQDSDYIEVFPEKTPFPPMVIDQYRQGEYLIPGNPGDKFNVSVRSSKTRPVWLLVVIPVGDSGGGGPTPPPPTSPGLDKLEKVSFDEALATKDSKTAKSLADGLKSIDFSKPKDLKAAVDVVQAVRAKVFYERADRTVDWSKYLKAVDVEFDALQLKTVAEYQKAVLANASGLERAAAMISSGMVQPKR